MFDNICKFLAETFSRDFANWLLGGKAQGRQETLQQVAINLLTTGMALEDISKVTGLSVEQLRVLQRERSEQ